MIRIRTQHPFIDSILNKKTVCHEDETQQLKFERNIRSLILF